MQFAFKCTPTWEGRCLLFTTMSGHIGSKNISPAESTKQNQEGRADWNSAYTLTPNLGNAAVAPSQSQVVTAGLRLILRTSFPQVMLRKACNALQQLTETTHCTKPLFTTRIFTGYFSPGWLPSLTKMKVVPACRDATVTTAKIVGDSLSVFHKIFLVLFSPL